MESGQAAAGGGLADGAEGGEGACREGDAAVLEEAEEGVWHEERGGEGVGFALVLGGMGGMGEGDVADFVRDGEALAGERDLGVIEYPAGAVLAREDGEAVC